MTDSEIILGLTANRQDTYRIFVDRYYHRIFRICFGILGNREDAEEISQDVFVEVYRSISFFKGGSSLSTWIYRIAVNKSLNQLKKNKNRKWMSWTEAFFASGDEQPAPVLHPGTTGPDRHLELREGQELVDRILQKIPDSQRVAFTLHKYEEFSHKEIAEIMELSVPAIESLVFRAKENIRKKYLHLLT